MRSERAFLTVGWLLLPLVVVCGLLVAIGMLLESAGTAGVAALNGLLDRFDPDEE